MEAVYAVDQFEPVHDEEELQRGLTIYVVRTGEALLATQETVDDLVRQGEAEDVGVPSVDWLGVPLKSRDSTFGAIVVQSYGETVRLGEKEKEILTSLAPHIGAALERKQAQDALRKSEEEHRLYFQEDITGYFIARLDGTLLNCNPAFARIFRFDQTVDAIGSNFFQRFKDTVALDAFLLSLKSQKELISCQLQLSRRNGEDVYVIGNFIAIPEDHGSFSQFKGYLFDDTERKILEGQLHQAEKIKAIGQLAGGVAHDFNNILMAILGYSELLQFRLGDNHPNLHEVQEILKSAKRGAALTQQLLAFSRKQMLEPKVLNINQVLLSMEGMLKRLIPEDIELAFVLGENVGAVKADPNQLEQVLINLAVNARDAMPSGGHLTIETSNYFVDDDFVRRNLGSAGGHHVLLAVSDNGTGMDESVKSRIFEPFFTTKEKGKGTGLGLAMVYGIVKQSGGYISLYSEPSHGTTFKIYLPRVDEPVDSEASPDLLKVSDAEHATILLVDDNDSVRNAIGSLLEMYGHKVLQASSGAEAVQIADAQTRPVDLLITDMIMPQMSGKELAEQMEATHPGLKVLFISGYTEEAVFRGGQLKAKSAFLSKPASADAIIRKIHDLLKR